MATITFSVSSKSDKSSGLSEVLVRFYHGKINQRAKTNVFVSPERWNTKTQRNTIPRVRIMTPENEQLLKELSSQNSKLDKLENFIKESFIEAGAGKTQLPDKWLVSLLQEYNFGGNDKPTEFFEVFDYFITTRKLSVSRKRHYKVLTRALKRFSLYTDTNITFDTLTADTLRKFEDYLEHEHELATRVPVKREKGKPERNKIVFKDSKFEKAYKAVPESRLASPRGANYMVDIMTKLRTFVLWYVEKGYSDKDPFSDYKIGSAVYGTPYYLTIAERNQLYNHDFSFNPRLEISRDIFVFQCVIGCRISDLKKFTKASVIDGAIEYIPRKTKDERAVIVRVPLNSIAREILDRYADTPGESLLPFPKYESYYNEDIKTICCQSGLNRIVTTINPTTREEEKHPIWEVASSHMARRSFVGNLYKQVKDPNLVGKLSGHKEGSRAFARYRDIDEEMTKDLVKLLEA